MTYLGLMEAEAERRETQRIGKRIGPGAVFSCGGNSASNSMSPGQGYLFVKCSPEHPSRGRVSYKAARREKTQQGNLEGSVPRPEGLVPRLQYSSKRAFTGSINKGVS